MFGIAGLWGLEMAEMALSIRCSGSCNSVLIDLAKANLVDHCILNVLQNVDGRNW